MTFPSSENLILTEALGYRQEYQRLIHGHPRRGYQRQIFRVRDGVCMYAGPGTDDAYPPRVHADWQAMPRQERLAIRAILDACHGSDELSGIADYLGERAGQEAVELSGLDESLRHRRDADQLHRTASQAEYELVARGGLALARERLHHVLQGDRDREAARRLLAITGAAHPADLLVLAQPRTSGTVMLRDRVIWWATPHGWSIGHGIVPPGLAGLAGLREDGSLGPMPQDPWLLQAWKTALSDARRGKGDEP